MEYPEIDATGLEWELRRAFDWVGAARREVRPWVDVAVWVHVPKRPGPRSDDRLPQEDTFLAEHRAWEIADVLVAGALGSRRTMGIMATSSPPPVPRR